LSWSSLWSSCSWLRIYSRITASPRPEVLTYKILLALSIHPRKVDSTLALDESHHFRHRVLGWNRDHHVHVIWHQMTLFNPALLLFGEAPEYLAQVLPKSLVQRLATTFGNENLCTPICCGLNSHTRPSEISSSCAWRLTIWSFLDGLPQMSNFYCHPGRTGGPPMLS
jgi:hypothetical protein